MEATGRDGGRGPSWSYRRHHEETESSCYTVSSSRSGTIVSTTTYTSGLSSGISMDAALQLDLELELRLGMPDEMDGEFAQPIKKPRIETEETFKKMWMKHTESLVQEFSRGPLENHSILGGGGGMSALERWFSELGVSWVLQLDVEHPTRGNTWSWILSKNTWSWIKALEKIMETIRLTESFFPNHGHGIVGMPGIREEEVESGNQASLDCVQFAKFFQETMSKMLVFVDVVCSSKSLSTDESTFIRDSLIARLDIYSALSSSAVSQGIRLQFHPSPPAEVAKIKEEMVSLLSAKQDKAFEATWSTLEEMRNQLKLEEYSLGTQTPQGPSGIHKATSLAMSLIAFLLTNQPKLSSLVSKAASLGKYYVPQTGHGEAPTSMSVVTEMLSCLEQKLINMSQLFLDEGLRLLFLVNNSDFMREWLETYYFFNIKFDMAPITSKVEHYIESYIQVSWAPMLACLSNHTPLCLGRNYSPLSKFESEFQKIYTTQKLWKVPDPKLRKRLRKAIIEKIIPGYTRHIEDNKVKNPKFTSHELEEMLQELFEG